MTEVAHSLAYKQIMRARAEVEASLESAKQLRNKWLSASDSNDLTKREVDQIGRSFKNKLLTVKWDCEDLEDLFNTSENELRKSDEDLTSIRQFIEDCKFEALTLIRQLDETESKSKILAKHGIGSLTEHGSNLTSLVQGNASSKYKKLTDDDADEVQFDRGQIESAITRQATIYNNVLFDHFEELENKQKNTNNSQIFSNLSRPETNVYMNTNENEIILDMLETEFYNPPNNAGDSSQFSLAIRKLFEADRNRVLGTLAIVFSFPILLIILLVA